MILVLRTLAIIVANLFKSRRRLEAENLWLRHQLKVALRRSPAMMGVHFWNGARRGFAFAVVFVLAVADQTANLDMLDMLDMLPVVSQSQNPRPA